MQRGLAYPASKFAMYKWF